MSDGSCFGGDSAPEASDDALYANSRVGTHCAPDQPDQPASPPAASLRTTKTPLELARAALGPHDQWLGKLGRVGRTLAAWGRIMRHERGLALRLAPLVAHGLVERVPTRLQLVIGSIDMVRFWISPAAADYYRQQGISFAFHQVLRVLDDPAAMLDPVGFFVDADAIIGHLLQVVHANPVYDVQLLSTHPDGLAALESQTRAVIDGSHPRARSIGAIVEESDYHARLLAYLLPRILAPTQCVSV